MAEPRLYQPAQVTPPPLPALSGRVMRVVGALVVACPYLDRAVPMYNSVETCTAVPHDTVSDSALAPPMQVVA